MEEDLRQRRARLEQDGADLWGPDPPVLHDCPLVMPLREWIEHPVVREVIHNGQTLQARALRADDASSVAGTLHASCCSSWPTTEPAGWRGWPASGWVPCRCWA